MSAYDPLQVAGQPPAATVWIKAIADTGATATCISGNAAARAGLFLAGKGQVTSATQMTPVNLYFGTLWIRGLVGGSMFYAWNFAGRTFLELGMPSAGHQALLGMDILRVGPKTSCGIGVGCGSLMRLDVQDAADVDEPEPQPLRPQQAALSQ